MELEQGGEKQVPRGFLAALRLRTARNDKEFRLALRTARNDNELGLRLRSARNDKEFRLRRLNCVGLKVEIVEGCGSGVLEESAQK
jgi:hypothetical protein